MTDIQRVPEPSRETADYIAALAHELAVLAARSELPVLRYLLEMARDEARALSQQGQDAAVEH